MASLRLRLFCVQSYCSWLYFAHALLNAIASVAGAEINASSAPSSSSPASILPPPPASLTKSSTSSAFVPASFALTDLSDPDLLTLAPRRIDFIITQQSGAQSLSSWLSTLGTDGKWPDSEIDYTTGCTAQRANWPAEIHWVRVAALAAAWHGGFPGASSTYVQNATLGAQIGLAMDWWFDRDFTVPSCLDTGGTGTCPCGTPGLWNTNWFANVIAIPRLVGQACLLFDATLTPTQSANCTHMTARSFDIFQRTDKPGFLVGANALDVSSIGIALGLLSDNASIVADAYDRVHNEVQAQSGFQLDGIQQDGSFSQHQGLLYNGNYGKDYSNDALELEIEAGGTRFAATGPSRTAFENLMNASQWMIYQNTVTGVLHWDFSTEGRFISFPVIDAQATGSLNINLTEIQELGTLWDSSILHGVYADLTATTATANVGHLLGNRHFWNNDYMVTRGTSYVSTLKMYSSRTRNAECTNSQNPVGFHLADGTTYTYLTGDEYEDIAAAWDWNMIPGTTVDYGATPLACGTINQVGVESFVGGVSTGVLGAAAMRYTNPLTKALSFQKAWFYFENDVQHVMVSILNSTSTAPVFSVLDQRKSDGLIYVDSLPVSTGNFSQAHTLFHASTGYVFSPSSSSPLTTPVSITTGNRTGSWSAIGTSQQPPATADLFTAWIPHDPANLANPVAYTVLPGRTLTQFQDEAFTDPLQTLSADTRVSAVQDSNGTTMAAFWQPDGGTVSVPSSSSAGTPAVDIASNSSLLMILDQRTWTVTVSDPTQLLVEAQMTFDVHGALPSRWGNTANKSVNVVFPVSPMAGSSTSLPLLDPPLQLKGGVPRSVDTTWTSCAGFISLVSCVAFFGSPSMFLFIPIMFPFSFLS
ncbi:chondroitin AC/alginate lyase [Gautieria morchelliformis]|nr:chondroitin AC/alginate lyase [Gautieria morchelliformis]